jgi:hypothetical protein
MKQYMTNQRKTDGAARRGIGEQAGPTRATVLLAAMEHPAPTGPVPATSQKPRHGKGE